MTKSDDLVVIDIPPAPLDWEISTDADGFTHALGDVSLTVAPGGRAFKRNFVKPALKTHERILVGELAGVRVYFDGKTLVMTTQDLYR